MTAFFPAEVQNGQVAMAVVAGAAKRPRGLVHFRVIVARQDVLAGGGIIGRLLEFVCG